VGVLPKAKYVVIYPFDTFWDSIDMPEALHPQTLLAYGMNGKDLPLPHGAPIPAAPAAAARIKSIKYLSHLRSQTV
jgi:DMSO/TMAO reductase YedYZ molybdopterin-dependent catalytic subunit